MNKNLTVKMGNCNHRRYIPRAARPGAHRRASTRDRAHPGRALPSVIDAYKTFDRRESGWTKVELDPS